MFGAPTLLSSPPRGFQGLVSEHGVRASGQDLGEWSKLAMSGARYDLGMTKWLKAGKASMSGGQQMC